MTLHVRDPCVPDVAPALTADRPSLPLLPASFFLGQEYISEVVDQLLYLADNNFTTFPLMKKLVFFRETRHAFGRTALMLSGGEKQCCTTAHRIPPNHVPSELVTPLTRLCALRSRRGHADDVPPGRGEGVVPGGTAAKGHLRVLGRLCGGYLCPPPPPLHTQTHPPFIGPGGLLLLLLLLIRAPQHQLARADAVAPAMSRPC
jgi:hypothetical protein